MNTTFSNTQKDNQKLSTATILILVIAMLPVLLFALTQMFPASADTTNANDTVSEAEMKRISAAERRAERAEARRAKKAEKAATTSVQHGMAPDPGMATFPPMEPMDFGGGFGPGMGFDNGMAMGPGMGGFGPGMGFGGGFGGGMGPGMF
jgi:hypothetical protein